MHSYKEKADQARGFLFFSWIALMLHASSSPFFLLHFLLLAVVLIGPTRERSAHLGIEFHARPLGFAVGERFFPSRKTAARYQCCHQHSRAPAAAVGAVH